MQIFHMKYDSYTASTCTLRTIFYVVNGGVGWGWNCIIRKWFIMGKMSTGKKCFNYISSNSSHLTNVTILYQRYIQEYVYLS